MNSEKYTLVEGGIAVRTRLAENVNEPYDLFLDATAVRRAGDDLFEREERARRILELLVESNIGYDRAEDGRITNDIEIEIGFTRRGYGVFGMSANILRPKQSDQIVTSVATHAMRQMAHDLGTNPDRDIPGMVYAHISTEHGMTFETNPAASSSMETDGQHYDPISERVKLGAHNLFTHEAQLICISGIIAAAKSR